MDPYVDSHDYNTSAIVYIPLMEIPNVCMPHSQVKAATYKNSALCELLVYSLTVSYTIGYR